MKKLITLLLVLVGIHFAPNIASAQGVAVVDLDEVAKELGVIEFIAITLENRRVELGKDLGAVQQNLQGQFNKTVAAAGENPSNEQRQQLLTINREMQTQFRKEEIKVNQIYQQERLKLINDFREELKPIALEIAKKKKLSVVLNKVMPPVYVWDDSVDITKAVTAAAKEKGLARKAPARKTQ